MSSYLRSWFPTSLAPAPPIATTDAEDADSQTTPTNITVDLPEEEDDVAPSFPALDSAQRASSSRTLDVPRILGDSALMPPPPVPALTSGVSRDRETQLTKRIRDLEEELRAVRIENEKQVRIQSVRILLADDR